MSYKRPYKYSFTTPMRLEVGRRYIAGEMAKDLADEFSISESTVRTCALLVNPSYEKKARYSRESN